LEKQDAQRIQDLRAIVNRVETYYAGKNSLPQSLALCDINPDTYVNQKTDRVTGQPYLYEVIDEKRFRVGAVFALPLNPEQHFRNDHGFWNHGSGLVTFEIDVTGKKK
jgi:hypothetical protein